MDINEISSILSQKSPKKSKIVTKKKIIKPIVPFPKVSEDEKKKMIKKYGGYYDENDNFIIDYEIDSENKLVTLLKDHKSELKKFISKNKLKFKKDPENTLQKTLFYYDQLTQQ